MRRASEGHRTAKAMRHKKTRKKKPTETRQKKKKNLLGEKKFGQKKYASEATR